MEMLQASKRKPESFAIRERLWIKTCHGHLPLHTSWMARKSHLMSYPVKVDL
jgi:hypothetical protein